MAVHESTWRRAGATAQRRSRQRRGAQRATLLGRSGVWSRLLSIGRLLADHVQLRHPGLVRRGAQPADQPLTRGQPIAQIDARQYGVVVFLVFDPAVAHCVGANLSALATLCHLGARCRLSVLALRPGRTTLRRRSVRRPRVAAACWCWCLPGRARCRCCTCSPSTWSTPGSCAFSARRCSCSRARPASSALPALPLAAATLTKTAAGAAAGVPVRPLVARGAARRARHRRAAGGRPGAVRLADGLRLPAGDAVAGRRHGRALVDPLREQLDSRPAVQDRRRLPSAGRHDRLRARPAPVARAQRAGVRAGGGAGRLPAVRRLARAGHDSMVRRSIEFSLAHRHDAADFAAHGPGLPGHGAARPGGVAVPVGQGLPEAVDARPDGAGCALPRC